jgi:serine/threonine protein kinase
MEKLGRYALHGEIASGGTASVYLGRLAGSAGFRRVVAIKRLHAGLVKDPVFRAMLLDEARIAARVRHVNVVSIVDVVELDGELLLVMDYVAGETLSRLRARASEAGIGVPPSIAAAIMTDVLRGLHAAHEASDARGAPLGIVHRDVSPQNVMVGVDGFARVVDFGIAKASGQSQTTRDGEVKGKAAYMAPEQLRGAVVDRRTDVFAAGIILWELLTGERLFAAETPAASMMRVLERDPELPSARVAVSQELDAVVMGALMRDPAARHATAEVMAKALEHAVRAASHRDVGAWVREIAADALDKRAAQVSAVETDASDDATEAKSSPASSPPPVGSPSPVVAAPRRRAVWGGIAAGVALVAATGLLLASRARVVETSDVRGRAETLPVATIAPSRATDSAAAAPVVSMPSTSPMPSPRPPRPRRPAASQGSRADHCTPPYVVGPTGNHVLKAECL